MATAEDAVVDFFEDGIEAGGRSVPVFRHAMRLNGFGASNLKSIVHVFQELWFYHVVGIEDDYSIVDLELWKVEHGILQRLGLRTLSKVGGEQGDGVLRQTHVSELTLMVGDDNDVKLALRIGLAEDGAD